MAQILPVNMTNPRKLGQIAQIFAEGQLRNQELQMNLLRQQKEAQDIQNVAKLYQDETAQAKDPQGVMNAFGKTAFGLMKFGQKASPILNWLEKDATLRMNALTPKVDTSRQPYEDFAAQYPSTPEGRAQAAKDWSDAQLQTFEQREKMRGAERERVGKSLQASSFDFKKKFDEERLRGQSFVDEEGNQMLSIYSGNGKFKNITLGKKGQPLPQVSEQDRNALSAGNVIKQTLDEIDSLYKPNYVGGVLAGGGSLVSQMQEATGTIDPSRADFRNKLQSIFNAFGELRSGKVLTANELERLEKEIPNENMSPVAFKQAMKNFRLTLDRIMEERLKVLRGSTKNSGAKPQSNFEIISVE